MKRSLVLLLVSLTSSVPAAASQPAAQASKAGAVPLTSHVGDITDIVLSSDGRFLVSASSDRSTDDPVGQIKLWNARSGKLIRDFDRSAPAVNGVASLSVSPDGRWLASANRSNDIALWDLSTGKVQRLFKNKGAGVCALAFVNGGARLLAVGGWSRPSGELQLWNVKTGLVERELAPSAKSPDRPDLDLQGRQVLSLSNDGAKLAVYSPAGVELWGTAPWKKLRTVRTGLLNGLFAMALSPDGSLLAFSQEDAHDIKLVDTHSGGVIRTLAIGNGCAESLLWRRDNQTLIAGLDGGGGTGLVRWWNVRTGRVLRTIDVSPGEDEDDEGVGDAQVLAPAPDGKTFAVGLALLGTGVSQRDIETGTLRVEYGQH